MRLLLGSLLCVLVSVSLVQAGSPHFTACTVAVSGATVTVDGKEAGLGNETQVHLVLTAEASCVNPGGHNPKAANKDTVTAEGDFPVQNGKALFSLEATAVFSPSCSPPMSVVFSAISVCDDAHGVCCALD